jgi:FHA domain-containing protein/von Willebrand factor type A domain-containing protein
MQAFSSETEVARMLGARRHRFVTGTITMLLWCLLPGAGAAQDGKVLANCAAPILAQTTSGTPASPATATVACELRSTDAVVFKAVTAAVKGRTESLGSSFKGFGALKKSLVAMFLVQISEPTRRGNVVLMADAVTKIADARDADHRFAAYTFANDLNLVADFSASKADFDKQVRAIKAATLPSQLYKSALEAIGKLAREPGDRKALIILGDGNSDDTSYEHEQVVKAAQDAHVVIHALGYLAETTDLPKFQSLQRLADDTGGFRKEVRVAGVQKFAVGKQFAPEVLENGGTLTFTLKEPPGPVAVTISADLDGGRIETVNYSLTMPAPSAAPAPARPSRDAVPITPAAPAEPETFPQRVLGWIRDNVLLAGVMGAALVAGGVGLTLLLGGKRAEPPVVGLTEDFQPVYGWLDMLDGNASRYPLKTTNVRIGRHRDNDICLQNDSISRRHALLHFNSDNRRFVITDLGGDNGVIVNKIKQQSHELSDGDLVELGEVRLRFRANMERVS